MLPSPPSAAATLDADRVYITMRDDTTLALDRETGDMVWHVDIESSWPLVSGGSTVFIAAHDEMHGLDATTGETRWRTLLPEMAVENAPFTVAGSTVIVPLAPDRLFAVRAADGAHAWQVTLEAAPVTRGVATDNGLIVFSLANSRLVALHADNGRVAWQRQLEGMLSEPFASGDRVYVGSTTNVLWALDVDTGSVDWQGRAGGDVIGAATDGGAAFAASLDNILRAHSSNGNQRWKKDLPTRPRTPPRAGHGIVWVAGVAPAVMAFASKDGAALGTFEAPAELQGPPLIDLAFVPFRVAVVLVTRDGRALGLKPTSMMFREAPPVPLPALPGRALTRERLPR